MQFDRSRKPAPKRAVAHHVGKNGDVGKEPPAQFGSDTIQGAFTISTEYKSGDQISTSRLNSIQSTYGDEVANEIVRLANLKQNVGKFTWNEIIQLAQKNVNNKREREKNDSDEEVDENEKIKEKPKKKIKRNQKNESSDEEEKDENIIEEIEEGEDKNIIEEKTKKNNVEKEESEETDEQFPDVRAMFIEIFKKHKINDDMLLKSMVSDLDFSKIEYPAFYKNDLELKGDERDKAVLNVASCFDTAARLFRLLRKGDKVIRVDKKMKEGIPLLTNLIKNNRDGRVIFWIGITKDAHGFTINVRNGKAELLQGFANSESLAQNIDDDENVYEIDDICGQLEDLLDKDKSYDAQEQLFGGSIDVEKVLNKLNKPKKMNEEEKEKYEQDKKVIKENLAKYKTTRYGEKNKRKYIPAKPNERKELNTEGTHSIFYRDMNDDDMQLEYAPMKDDSEIVEQIDIKVKSGLKALL